jgi:hypothetical protein
MDGIILNDLELSLNEIGLLCIEQPLDEEPERVEEPGDVDHVRLPQIVRVIR